MSGPPVTTPAVPEDVQKYVRTWLRKHQDKPGCECTKCVVGRWVITLLGSD